MSLAPSKPGLPNAMTSRHRFGATLMLAVMGLLAALFWAGVIRLLVVG
jgi:hypothetical protein